MRAEDCVGRTGRALTDVAASGRVEVSGESFDAMTIGPPIPAGEPVEVTGWRLVDATGYVLSVRTARPGERPSTPLPPQTRTPDERLDELERLIAGLSRSDATPGGVGWWLLTYGHVASIISCVAAPIYAVLALNQAADLPPSAPNPRFWIVIGSTLVFLYSAAMAVVFSRVKQPPHSTDGSV